MCAGRLSGVAFVSVVMPSITIPEPLVLMLIATFCVATVRKDTE